MTRFGISASPTSRVVVVGSFVFALIGLFEKCTTYDRPKPAISLLCVGRCMILLPVADGSGLSGRPVATTMTASTTPLAVSHHKLILRLR